MPYIQYVRRERMDAGEHPLDAGELNYKLTTTILDYLQFHGQKYQTINDIIGALEGAKLEFYRRFVANYENEKIDTNGDVY
jgi:hypothetical protein